jgi:TonB-linked SusC/RagA family outer membrane protein
MKRNLNLVRPCKPPLQRILGLFLLFFVIHSVSAQTTVTGKVTGTNETQPIVGASVLVKGTKVGTTTNAEGNFTIAVPSGRKTLVISSVGYENMEVDISNSANVSVQLKETTGGLTEVVVTGYTAQRKKDITGSVSVVNVADMKQTPVGTGEEALQGRASGITVISSAQPGGSSDIRIRGITSFYGNNAPLIIVDGVRSNIHDINANDIESLQVLKDAAAAIYGVAGSNGVIIITTKKGKSGRAKVSYDAYVGLTTHGDGYDMANTQEEANAIWLQQKNSGIAVPSHAQFGTGANPVIPDFITPAGVVGTGPDPATYDINTNQITRANKLGTDWYKEITRNAMIQSHNLSVSSGSDKSSYFFSVGYLNQEGILKYQYLKRYSVRANTQFVIKDKIRVGENAYIFYKQNPRFGNQSEGSPFTTAYRESAIIPVYDIMGNFAGTKSNGLGNARNPFADIYRTKDNRNHNWNISGNIYAEVDFLRHFTARTSFGGIMDNNYSFNFNYVGYENAEGNTGSNSFGENAGYNTSWTFTNTLTYSNEFGAHNVRLLLGTEAIKTYGRYLGGTRSNYFSEDPNFWIIDAGTGTQANSGGAYQSGLWSQIGKLEYGYAGKYLVNASLRRDGFSGFAEDQRWGYFPGVSAAWRISEEDFLKTVSFITDLKLRYSWAKLGSTGAVASDNPYDLYSSRLGKSAYDLQGNSTGPLVGFYKSHIGNESTTWEEDIITNAGFDVVLFNNKLDVTIDWYKKKVSGLLFPRGGIGTSVIFSADGSQPFVNLGDMQNTGIDFNATYHANIGKELKLNITGIFTSYKNKIVDMPGLAYRDGDVVRNNRLQRFVEGHAFGEFFGYRVLGIFQNADDVAKSPTQVDAQPGVFKYQDTNGDGKIDADDRTFIGNPNPDFTYGLNISASYKNFDFSAFFFGMAGNDIFNNTLYFTDFPDFFKGGLRREAAINSWTPTNTNAKVPILRTTGGFSTDNSGYANSYFISKGSYFRSKQMQIGYTLPAKLLSKYGIDRSRVYIQAANLFTITKYEGLDPELPTQPDSNGNIFRTHQYGIDQGSYPHTPAFLVGININF